MQHTKINEYVKRDINCLLKKIPSVLLIVQEVHAQGGRTFLVGGAVRDLLLKIEVKDIDLEVHGLDEDQLYSILKKFGNVDYVGKAFGVFKFFNADLKNLDISLPRADSTGRKPGVSIDPYMSLEDAFRRRDITINAMGIDLITDELVDPFGGYNDLHNKIVRAVDPDFFIQDPLRFYRVMQFVGRFDMKPDEQLNEVCARMDLSAVSIERIESEFEKLFLKSVYPSGGIRWLHVIGRLRDLFPEIEAMVGIAQNPVWHPEGDVFEHSMQTLDAAAVLMYDNDVDKLMVMYAALFHDLGKVTTTRTVGGKIISYGHEQESARRAKIVLKRITGKKDLADGVVALVACHMQPLQFIAEHAKQPAYKRLALRLAPFARISLIARLALCDRRGRNPGEKKPLSCPQPDVDLFIERAQAAEVFNCVEEPILLGRDLMDIVQPGPKMGALIKRAYEIQIEDNIRDKDELKKRVLRKN